MSGVSIWVRILCAMLCITFVMMVAPHVGAEPSQLHLSRLWEKAAHYMAHHHWVPEKIVHHEKTRNLKGELEEDIRLVFGFSPGEDQKIRQVLIAAEKNGNDIGKQVRRDLKNQITLNELVGDSPFRPDNKQKPVYRLNGQYREINDLICAGFFFFFYCGDKAVEGTAWLDQETGLPVEMHSRVTSVPFMEDDVKIISFSEIEYFIITDQGHCLSDRSKTQMDIEIPKMRFKGQVTVINVCKDHWEYENTK